MRALVEQILNEQPHVFLDMDDDSEDKVWDFCAEDKPKSWIVQLINLYALKKLITLNKNKNIDQILYLTREEINLLTKRLMSDPFFLTQAKSCIKGMIRDKKFNTVRMLDKFLPSELKTKLELN